MIFIVLCVLCSKVGYFLDKPGMLQASDKVCAKKKGRRNHGDIWW